MKRVLLSGMTLIEIIIATTILTIIFTMVSSTFFQFQSSRKKIVLSNTLYIEARDMMERITREIQNGNIDYQGYWREAILQGKANDWRNHADFGGINEKGSLQNGAPANGKGFNAHKNCGLVSNTSDPQDVSGNDILAQYRLQFIYPGKPAADNGNDETSNQVHLNCLNDRINDAEYNIYDDDTAYGRGPAAMSHGDHNSSTLNSKDVDFDWNGNTTNTSAPLLLSDSNAEKSVFTRTALRWNNNRLEMIRFKAGDTEPFDTSIPPDFIPDTWTCEQEFICNGSNNGTYIWNSPGNIRSLNDANLVWQDITPESMEITDFHFFITPKFDPWKGFYMPHTQKPQITIVFTAVVRDSSMRGTIGTKPSITLQTTVVPRMNDALLFDN